MNLFEVIALVLSLAILCLIALMAVSFFRKRCPRCGKHGLKLVGNHKWSARDSRGYRIGGTFSFYSCRFCPARLRWDLRTWSDATEGDWKKHAKTAV